MHLGIVEAGSPRTELEQLVEDYLASVRARGLSPKTADIYGRTLRGIFLPFCREQGIDAPAQLTRRHLDRLAAQLLDAGPKGKPLSRNSVATYLRTTNSFMHWATAEGEVAAGVAARLPQRQRKVLEVLSREEIQRIEDAAPTERDKLLIRIMADGGLRLGEVVGLRTGDLVPPHGRHRFLRVRGKGRGGQGLERLVPVVPELYNRLRRFAERGRPRDVGTDSIFISRRRKTAGADLEPLDGRGVQEMLRYAAISAGIERRVYPHLLRHSFATWALRRNMNPLQLQQILGHADLTQITQTYAHLNADDAAEALLAVLRADDR